MSPIIFALGALTAIILAIIWEAVTYNKRDKKRREEYFTLFKKLDRGDVPEHGDICTCEVCGHTFELRNYGQVVRFADSGWIDSGNVLRRRKDWEPTNTQWATFCENHTPKGMGNDRSYVLKLAGGALLYRQAQEHVDIDPKTGKPPKKKKK